MKPIARRNDLDLSLAGKLRYGLAGILGWDFELPNLGGSRCDGAQRSDDDCSAHRSTNPIASHAPSFIMHPYRMIVRPLLILDQKTDDGTYFPMAI